MASRKARHSVFASIPWRKRYAKIYKFQSATKKTSLIR